MYRFIVDNPQNAKSLFWNRPEGMNKIRIVYVPLDCCGILQCSAYPRFLYTSGVQPAFRASNQLIYC